jgi:PAS domain S-box-containing protein
MKETEIEYRLPEPMASDLSFEYPHLLQAMFDCMGEGLYAISADGRVLLINPTASRILGYAPKELIGKVMHDTTHYKHRDGTPFPRHECDGFQVITHGRTVRVDQDFFIRKDGSFVPVSYSSSPIQRDGKIIGAVVAFQDLSVRLEQEVALRKAEQHLRLAYQAADVGTWEWEVNSDTLSVSQEFAHIIGLPALKETSLREFSSTTIFYDSDRRLFETALQQALKTRREFQTEFRIRRGAEVRWVLMAGKAFYNLGNTTVLGVSIDTTELKHGK